MSAIGGILVGIAAEVGALRVVLASYLPAVTMATMQAEFIAVAEAPPPPKRRRQASRFAWINQIGAERVMGDF